MAKMRESHMEWVRLESYAYSWKGHGVRPDSLGCLALQLQYAILLRSSDSKVQFRVCQKRIFLFSS